MEVRLQSACKCIVYVILDTASLLPAYRGATHWDPMHKHCKCTKAKTGLWQRQVLKHCGWQTPTQQLAWSCSHHDLRFDHYLLLLQDHINFTLGRQSFNVKQLDNATAAFKHLLTRGSKQSAPQQAAFLREYLFVYKVGRHIWVLQRANVERDFDNTVSTVCSCNVDTDYLWLPSSHATFPLPMLFFYHFGVLQCLSVLYCFILCPATADTDAYWQYTGRTATALPPGHWWQWNQSFVLSTATSWK